MFDQKLPMKRGQQESHDIWFVPKICSCQQSAYVT